MVLDLCNKAVSLSEFRSRFYFFYIDEVPENLLSENDQEYYSRIHEKLDWVDGQPTEEERAPGWIDESEYLTWVQKQSLQRKGYL